MGYIASDKLVQGFLVYTIANYKLSILMSTLNIYICQSILQRLSLQVFGRSGNDRSHPRPVNMGLIVQTVLGTQGIAIPVAIKNDPIGTASLLFIKYRSNYITWHKV